MDQNTKNTVKKYQDLFQNLKENKSRIEESGRIIGTDFVGVDKISVQM